MESYELSVEKYGAVGCVDDFIEMIVIQFNG
jgi:hypothetical protein